MCPSAATSTPHRTFRAKTRVGRAGHSETRGSATNPRTTSRVTPDPTRTPSRGQRIITRAVAATLGVGGCTLLLAAGVAALSDPQPETRVSISDQLDRRPLFEVRDLAPGDQVERCWQITGQNNPTLRLWAASTGPLAPYLQVDVTSGSSSGTPSSGDCGGFQPRDTLGSTTLADMPTGPAGAIVDSRAFVTGERRAYRLRVTVRPDAPQRRTATASFLACAQAPGRSACDPVSASPAVAAGLAGSAPGGSASRCVPLTLVDGAAKQIRKGRFVQRRVGPGRARMALRVTGPYGRRAISARITTTRLNVRSVRFDVNRRPLRLDTQRPFTATVPNTRLKVKHNEIRARLLLASGKVVTIRWGFHLSRPRDPGCR